MPNRNERVFPAATLAVWFIRERRLREDEEQDEDPITVYELQMLVHGAQCAQLAFFRPVAHRESRSWQVLHDRRQ